MKNLLKLKTIVRIVVLDQIHIKEYVYDSTLLGKIPQTFQMLNSCFCKINQC